MLIIEGKSEEENEFTLENAVEMARGFINDGLSTNEAAKAAAKETKIKKSDIYKMLNE